MRSPAAVMADLIASGLTPEQIVLMAELATCAAMQVADGGSERTARQERNRRYYDSKRLKASESVLNPSEQDASESVLTRLNSDGERLNQDASRVRDITSKSVDTGKRRKKDISSETDFDRFWSAYPKRVEKPSAREAFRTAIQRAGLDEILAGIERARAGRQWRDGYIPYPAKWLKRDGWQDEIDAAPPKLEVIHGRSTPADRQSARQDNLARALSAPSVVAPVHWSG